MSNKVKKQKNIFFSQCLYKPIITNEEVISIGLLVHIPECRKIKFLPSTALSRILKFDDDLTKEELDLYFKYLTYEFSAENLKNKFHSIDLSNECSDVIEGITQNQVNHIRFSKPKSFGLEENETYDMVIKQLKELYLYFDTPKEKRPNRDELVRMMRNRVKSTIGKELIENAPKEKSPMDNPIPYDFKVLIKNNDYLESVYIKILKLDYNRPNSLVSELQRLIYKLDYSDGRYSSENFKILSNIKEDDLSEDVLELLTSLSHKGFKVQHFENVINELKNSLEINY
ncbi:MAG TPA: hypothetical protein VIG63_00855 [Savagea sp.]